jgi:hypothetical protein
MNEQQLIDQFIRVEKRPNETRILVCRISWAGPATPLVKWEEAARIADNAGQDVIQKTVRGVLNTEKYFQVCRECNERTPTGWMHDAEICQACAEKNHGVVY